MTSSEFASFVLAILVAMILFFGGQRALIELTDNEDFALPVQVTVDEPETPELPSVPVVPPSDEDIPAPTPESEAPTEP